MNKKRLKQLDKAKEEIFKVINKYDMKNEEAAALLTATMQNILVEPHNEIRLRELKVDANKLSIDQVVFLQKTWATEYTKRIMKKYG